jgi:hypothetical protein
MKTKFYRFGLGLILSPIAPLAGFLSLWWSSYAFLPEKWIPICALSGLLLGLLADILFLKRWINLADRLGFKFWIVFYLFYSVGIFGFVMGVPVLNALLAIPAGFVVAGKLAAQTVDPQRVRRATRLTAWFTTGILVLICLASTALALSDPYTGGSLKGMLGLNFEVTQNMIIALILAGGAALLIFNWCLTAFTVWFSNMLLRQKTA